MLPVYQLLIKLGFFSSGWEIEVWLNLCQGQMVCPCNQTQTANKYVIHWPCLGTGRQQCGQQLVTPWTNHMATKCRVNKVKASSIPVTVSPSHFSSLNYYRHPQLIRFLWILPLLMVIISLTFVSSSGIISSHGMMNNEELFTFPQIQSIPDRWTAWYTGLKFCWTSMKKKLQIF